MDSSTLPVPRGIDWPTMMFSITPLRGSVSPLIAALTRCWMVSSKAALARTLLFCPLMP
ncbi:hypothetical protein ES707_15700 [subsurface metagenome]